MKSRLRILHLIVRLEQGGAEQSLLRLVTHTGEGRDVLEHQVICFGTSTPLAEKILDAGVEVHFLSLSPAGLLKARALIREFTPNVVQGWMYYGNLLASWLTPNARERVVWNVRNEWAPHISLKIRLAIALSRLCHPNTVIYNSQAGVSSHREYAHLPSVLINNGIDTDLYRPDECAREAFRRKVGADKGDTLIALVSRYRPHKGVVEYLELVAKFDGDDVRFLIIGPGMDRANTELAALIDASSIDQSRIQLLGRLTELEKVYPALDLLVISSYQEGAPNALLEAMACGVTVVGTDVGDVATIIDDENRVCPPRNSKALQAVVEYGLKNLHAFSSRDRQRIVDGYGNSRCQLAYQDLYMRFAGSSN